MKVKPKWSIRVTVRSFALEVALTDDFADCELFCQSAYGINETPIKVLAETLGLTGYEIWKWNAFDSWQAFSDLKPRRVSPLLRVLVDDTNLAADVVIITLLGKCKIFGFHSIDVLNSDLTKVWTLQRVLSCNAEFWQRGKLVKRT